MLGCDWLNMESVAKQVARTMLHIVLLCNLKTIQLYVLLKKSENSAARGGVKRKNHTCNLQKLFSETSFRGHSCQFTIGLYREGF